MRGTLRYEGFGEVMEAVARLGLLEDTWSGVADEPVRVHEPRVLQVLQGLSLWTCSFPLFEQKPNVIYYCVFLLAQIGYTSVGAREAHERNQGRSFYGTETDSH